MIDTMDDKARRENIDTFRNAMMQQLIKSKQSFSMMTMQKNQQVYGEADLDMTRECKYTDSENLNAFAELKSASHITKLEFYVSGNETKAKANASRSMKKEKRGGGGGGAGRSLGQGNNQGSLRRAGTFA